MESQYSEAVILMTAIYDSKKIQIKIYKEKWHMEPSPGETKHKFPFLVMSYGDVFNSPRSDIWQHMYTFAN